MNVLEGARRACLRERMGDVDLPRDRIVVLCWRVLEGVVRSLSEDGCTINAFCEDRRLGTLNNGSAGTGLVGERGFSISSQVGQRSLRDRRGCHLDRR